MGSVACSLLLLAMLAAVEATYTTSQQGTAKDAWPELVGVKSEKALELLKASGLVKDVRVWGPAFEIGDKPVPRNPADRGTPQDVWIYTDQHDEVYETPRRGVWHPNRIYPGWTNLLGKDLKYAVNTILNDFFGVTVRSVPEGALNTVKLAYTRDRVYVQHDKKGKVSRIPVVY